jgi:hypothetical protein
MTIVRAAQPKRRPPPPADRYRAIARAAREKRARRPLPPLLRGLTWGVVVASALVVTNATASAFNVTGASLGSWVGSLTAAPAATSELTVTPTTGQVGVAPLLDATPEFTKDPTLLLQGLVPSFGIAADRKVEVQLNGATATFKFDANGRFAVPLTLKEGPNHMVIALIGPNNETIATTSQTVTLNRVPPPLMVSKPTNNDTIDGTTLTVEGKSNPGTVVLVNDRSVIVGQDGSFSDSVTVAVGSLPITVIARDRAGNETKTQLTVTVKPQASPGAAATVAVTLTNPTVKPGGFVTANVSVLNGTAPQAGRTVSLQVGVIAIGTAVTDANGRAVISFFAPPNEGTAQVVVLAGAASGSAVLTIAK